ncbi:MAG: acyl-CoA dehydrogenase [Caldithrix sp.]|nr:acyl-CoA dehydrogenase [Caldithrix sp.]
MFQGVDLFQLSDWFTEEERMVRDSVRHYVQQSYLPIVSQYHRKGLFPKEVIPQLGEMGLLGVTIPEKYGGPELTYTIYGLAMQELERGDSGLRSFASVQGSLVMYPIFTYGSEAQKNEYLPKLASGELIGCYGLTEPDYGSNPGGMRTKAVKTDGGWLLNGSKMWITNGSIADVAVIWAKTDEGVSGFIVDTDSKGFTAKAIEGKYSLRASDTGEMSFDDVFVPEENRLPLAKGLKAPLSCLSEARYGIAWGAIGSAMACYDESLNYAQTRIQFDKPIGAFQLVQQKLVEMVNEITKGQMLNYRLGRMKDDGKARHYHISLAKRNNVDAALTIARQARSILAASGITNEYQTIRHMLNLESVYTYEGTHDIHTLIIGNHITGLNAVQ